MALCERCLRIILADRPAAAPPLRFVGHMPSHELLALSSGGKLRTPARPSAKNSRRVRRP
jgi:hypothetical protein